MQKTNELPKFYLITPDFNGHQSAYLKKLELSLIKGVKLVQLRSKNLSINEYIRLAKDVISLVHTHQAKLLLSSTENLLSILDADGIHMPSERYFDLNQRPIHHNYLFSVSCHNREQLISAENIGADCAILCPVFATPSSPKGIPLGWEKFSELVKFTKLPIYALGGLSMKDCQIAYDHGAYGIAAIRALWG